MKFNDKEFLDRFLKEMLNIYDEEQSKTNNYLMTTLLITLSSVIDKLSEEQADTLKNAKKTPVRYRNLVVKVAGYSALFVTLDEQLQDQIISRTEHVV